MEVMNFIEKQWKLISGVLGALILVGGVVVLVSVQNEKKEKKAQESYFAVEKKLLDLKSKQTNTKDKKAVPTDTVNFAQVKSDLEKVIAEFTGSKAAQMAAIHLAGLFSDENNFDSALSVLQKVENKDSGLVNTLVQQQIGQIFADNNKCQEAINVWQKILNRKESSFIHNDVKIQQALCYTKLNDLSKAEEILTNLSNQALNSDISGSSTAKEAEKYLRLIRFKKASGT